ncbi:hypothetical protein L0Z11_11500 [Burkholderia multivorans]|uniref:hypothetical protein n=1 Tax=Burkholderia multivorans TaxID=87883 RepID=UPI0020186B25|nr:hypothetical protein [Burkholderia multivorans]UQN68311.1 hypothetical protein L0Z45_11520 [Burkholderia multivorans]UQN74040.1 hypothetical protein L0Z11_11500 [Burkholderia multivorans]
MDEREILRIAVRHDIDQYLTEALTLEFVRDVLKAARRTTPDRESIIEECAKVCEMERDALRKNEAIWDANPNLRPDEDYVSEWEASACRGEEYAAAIRALKTAPTSDQGEKS